MKKILFAALALSLAVLSSCNKDGEFGNTKVTFRKANIAGAQMLAIAQGGAETKAEGDVTVGPKALYTVSEDGTMVQVTYNVEVEGVDGEVAETIQANLIISPNFIFPVGEGWLWLANCHLDVKDGWSNNTIPQGPARSAISKLINGFSENYHERHGAHYLIRKSDGAMFEWTNEAGAPWGMDDGFKQPNFLNGWFHQLDKDLFVKVDGWGGCGENAGKLFRLQDKGNTLDAVNVLGDNIGCGGMWPADGYLGMRFNYDGASALGILPPPSFEPVLLSMGEKEATLMSINKKLYVAVNEVVERYYNDGKEQYFDGYDYKSQFYNLTVSGASISLGNLICTFDGWLSGESSFISSGETLSWWGGDGYGSAQINTFDPKAGKITSRALPEHYPSNETEYVDGVGYTVDGTVGYWECDLSKDAAEYVALDWSSAAEYQNKIVPGTLRLERFEAASLTLQFKASLTNGTQLNFYTPVTGADRGKIKTTVGGENNAGMVVTTMVRLN